MKIRMIKVTPDFKLEDVVFDDKNILGDELYGKGSLATPAGIRYPVLLDNLKQNKVFSRFTMLVDEEGSMKRLDLNLIGTVLYSVVNGDNFQPIVGDVYVVKIGKNDYVDMFDREYEILKNQLSGMIDVILESIEAEGISSDPSSFGKYEE